MYSTDAGLQRLAVALATGKIRPNSVGLRNLHPAARATVEQSAESIQEIKIARMHRDMDRDVGCGKKGIRYRTLRAGRWLAEARLKRRRNHAAGRRLFGRNFSQRNMDIATSVLYGDTLRSVASFHLLTPGRVGQITYKYFRHYVANPRPTSLEDARKVFQSGFRTGVRRLALPAPVS